RYIKDYLRCIDSVDENVGRVLDYLDDEGLAENTLVMYTSDQGFYLGDDAASAESTETKAEEKKDGKKKPTIQEIRREKRKRQKEKERAKKPTIHLCPAAAALTIAINLIHDSTYGDIQAH
ncbi:sulfatase-like hydrolase/transferase, partial [Bremerella sp. JC817]|uniref:sulfatase-like hydrolase/transferase n=1 Tax=Bremerella sp. JC817 TaxID=3231756 RepID=UPI00345B318B